jgi:hypothetical protein
LILDLALKEPKKITEIYNADLRYMKALLVKGSYSASIFTKILKSTELQALANNSNKYQNDSGTTMV